MISRFRFFNSSLVAILSVIIVNGSAMATIKEQNLPKIKSSAVVAGSSVSADSVVRNADENLAKELANIQLANIPNPLGEIILDRETISKKLGDFADSVEIPEYVKIQRLGTVLKSDYVKSRIEEICQDGNNEKLSFDYSKLSSVIVLPGNVVDWNVKSNSSNELGMRLFVLEANTEGGPFRQLIQVNVSKTIEAAELCQLAKPGEVITEDMVKPVSVVIKNEKNNTVVAYNDVVGKKLDRFKSAGTIIRNSDLSKTANSNKIAKTPKSTKTKVTGCRTPQALNMMATTTKKDIEKANWLIKPGENVEYRVNSGALSLSIPAKAVQGGNSGDEIELINLKNKRKISGVITEKGVVEYAQK